MMHPYKYVRRKARQLWSNLRTPGLRYRVRRWFLQQPIVLNRAKVFVAIAAGVFTIASFNHQVSAQADVAVHNQCLARVDGRNDLRASLLFIVDLSDLIPGGVANPKVIEYTTTRTHFINASFPALNPDDC